MSRGRGPREIECSECGEVIYGTGRAAARGWVLAVVPGAKTFCPECIQRINAERDRAVAAREADPE